MYSEMYTCVYVCTTISAFTVAEWLAVCGAMPMVMESNPCRSNFKL